MSERTEQGSRREALVRELKEAAGKPLSVGDLMQRARIHPGERTAVKRTLRELVKEGGVHREGKRFFLVGTRKPHAEPGSLAAPRRGALHLRGRGGRILGTLKKHRDGFGFVARLDRQGDDVFVPKAEADQALDGDLVRVEIVQGRGGRSAGRIVEVVERRRRLLLGAYYPRGRSSFVVPTDPSLGGVVPVEETSLAQEGEMVKVALDPEARDLRGRVTEVVGRPGEPRVEVLRVAYAKGFADIFPDEVSLEAEKIPSEVRVEDKADRKDLTELPLVTIDGEDARDFDDAVFVERIDPPKKGAGPHFRLVVAIADVAHYVRAGTALDAEASRRGTSVYFPMQVLPMLPERLSNGICSLNPSVERLCMVADIVLDDKGETISAEVYQGLMKSAARCTYEEVARVLDGEKVPSREVFRPLFSTMADLQERRTAMRARRGAIDFDLPESKIVVDAEGQIVNIEKRPRNRAHRIVEEFMLAANEAVARWFGVRELPTVYRVHGVPDEEKLGTFLALAESHGFGVPELPVSPAALNALLERFRGHRQQRALNQLLLRAMMQAVYTTENIGHYGLASEHYLHFTSPIRRYPDLLVHRLLKEEWLARQGRPVKRTPEPVLEELAALSSDRERAAMEAEREVAAYYAALLMKDHVGERFDGVIAAVAEAGAFVELRPFFVEGMVQAELLGEDVELDPVQHALVNRSTGRAFRIGDALRVEVSSVSLSRRRIELRTVEAEGALRTRREEGSPPAEESRERGRGLKSALASRRGERSKGSSRSPRPAPRRGGKSSERRGTGHAEKRPQGGKKKPLRKGRRR